MVLFFTNYPWNYIIQYCASIFVTHPSGELRTCKSGADGRDECDDDGDVDNTSTFEDVDAAFVVVSFERAFPSMQKRRQYIAMSGDIVLAFNYTRHTISVLSMTSATTNCYI